MSEMSVQCDPVIAGNVYPKYTTHNPVARHLVANFMAALRHLVRQTGALRVHEVGCGEGFLARQLAADGHQVRGTDLSPAAIAQAQRHHVGADRRIEFQVADVYDLQPAQDAAELVICCEVLEHLPDPVRALEVLQRLARPHLIVSVPREPLWRILNVARGKYWPTLGNTPGHLQHWSTGAFVGLLEQHFDVLEVLTPLPWTMARCRIQPSG